MIGAFGLLDPKYPPASRWHGLSLSMVVVLDRAGIVLRRFSSRRERDRADAETVLRLLR